MNIQSAIRFLSRGRCILFTGSGFSLGANNMQINPDGTRGEFSKAADLTKKLLGLLHLDKNASTSLSKVAQYCRDTRPPAELVEFLRLEFTHSTTTPSQRAIGEIPWKRVYTTNYDEIIEDVSRRHGIIRNTVTIDTPIKSVSKIQNVCVHLNGSISNLSVSSLDSSFKLTNRSYNSDDLNHSPWFEQFKSDLLSADAVFFIGFSADYDLDLSRVFQTCRELREKSFFIVHETTSPIDLNNIKNFGQPLTIGLDGFVELYRKEAVCHTAVAASDTTLHSFNKPIVGAAPPREVKATDFYNLLTLGQVKDDLLGFSVREPERFHYFIYRDRIDSLIDEIATTGNHYLITSRLGNGKTMMLRGLAVKLSRQDISVYFFNGLDGEYVMDEVDLIASTNRKAVLIFDGYSDSIPLINRIHERGHENLTLVLADRTSSYETTVSRFNDIAEQLKVSNLDILSEGEVGNLISLFDNYGLWGDDASKSAKEKKDIIGRNHNQIATFLLSRLDARQLRDAYSLLISRIAARTDYYHAIILLLLNSYFNLNLSYSQLLETAGGNVMNNAAFKQNSTIRELIDFDSERITFSSSILAQHLLSEHIDKELLRNFIITLFKTLDIRRHEKAVRRMLRKLMQYRELNKLFKSNAHIHSIYENIASTQFCSENPLFWLQRAVAHTANRIYPLAKAQFDTAYSYARQQGFDTFQIDNHYAHFLLQRAIADKSLDPRTPIEVFRDAHSKLLSKKRGHELYYFPFKVAADYPKFYNCFAQEFSMTDIAEIKKSCGEMIDKAEEYLDQPQATERRMVADTIKNIKTIVSS